MPWQEGTADEPACQDIHLSHVVLTQNQDAL